MSDQLIVRELRTSDMPSFIELCKSRDSHDSESAQRRAAIVEWLAFHNPAADGEPTYFVGMQGDRVIAHLGRMPTRFAVNGSIESGSYIHDLYVHPEVRARRGQGFFLAMDMYRAAENASAGFCVCVWTNEINIAMQKARKYQQMWADRYRKIISLDGKIDRIAPTQIANIAKPIARKILAACDNAREIVRRRSSYVTERVDFFDSRFDELADTCAASMGIAPYKDSAYLRWKYINRPGLDAVTYSALNSRGDLIGFVVVVNPKPGRRFVNIAELVTATCEPALIGLLIDVAIAHARRAGFDQVIAVATDARFTAELRSRFFFSRMPHVPLFLANADSSPDAALLGNIDNWHMSLGDSEGPF